MNAEETAYTVPGAVVIVETFGCAEVEAALLEHEAILEAIVYAVPDERLGEEVGTTVYSPSAIDVDDLNAFLNARVARFKIPRHFKIITEPLPRIASGKINKRELRELKLISETGSIADLGTKSTYENISGFKLIK